MIEVTCNFIQFSSFTYIPVSYFSLCTLHIKLIHVLGRNLWQVFLSMYKNIPVCVHMCIPVHVHVYLSKLRYVYIFVCVCSWFSCAVYLIYLFTMHTSYKNDHLYVVSERWYNMGYTQLAQNLSENLAGLDSRLKFLHKVGTVVWWYLIRLSSCRLYSLMFQQGLLSEYLSWQWILTQIDEILYLLLTELKTHL